MMQLLLIGLGAGVAAALLVASVVSGSVLALILSQLAALPILIAAIGWSHWAGLIAAGVAASILATVLAPAVFFSFLVGIGLPAWWLGYLALLARPTPAAPDAMEWYPVGRLVLWTAILGALAVIVAIGIDEASFRDRLSKALDPTLRGLIRTGRLSGITEDDVTKIVPVMVAIFPAVAAIIVTIISLINLGLAALIVNVSGRLKRPWPSLPHMEFPPIAPALFAVGIAGTFLSGLAGTIASILSASLSVAYAVLGLAVLHAITVAAPARFLLLGLAYVATLLQIWPLLLFVMLGLADTIFNFRGRVAAAPPASRTE